MERLDKAYRAMVVNLWHTCKPLPSPQHRVHQISLLESQRDQGLGYSPSLLYKYLRRFLTSPKPLPSNPVGLHPPSPVWGKGAGGMKQEGAVWALSPPNFNHHCYRPMIRQLQLSRYKAMRIPTKMLSMEIFKKLCFSDCFWSPLLCPQGLTLLGDALHLLSQD